MVNRKSIGRLLTISMLITLAVVLNIFENFIPFTSIPGAKLGLANVVTLIALFILGAKEAMIVTVMRIVIAALLSGRFNQTFLMSLSGAFLSLMVMIILKQLKVGIPVISVIGSIFHALGQGLMGMLVIDVNSILAYIPIMALLSTIGGAFVGVLAQKAIRTAQEYLDLS